MNPQAVVPLTHPLWPGRTKHSPGWNSAIRTGTWALEGTASAPAKKRKKQRLVSLESKQVQPMLTKH